MNKKRESNYIKSFGLFITIFLVTFFIFGSSLTIAESGVFNFGGPFPMTMNYSGVTPGECDDNSENPFFSIDAENTTNYVYIVKVHAFHSDQAGCDPYSENLGTGVSISGMTEFPAHTKGHFDITYDASSYSCGRVQYDAEYKNKTTGDVTTFIGQVINYGVDCVVPPIPPKTTCPTPPPIPSCSYAGPDGTTVSGNSTQRFFAYGVTNANEVYFPVWSNFGTGDLGQDDLVWYTGINNGGGTWYADVNLANHVNIPNSQGYGDVVSHVYLKNSGDKVFCDRAHYTTVGSQNLTINVLGTGSGTTTGSGSYDYNQTVVASAVPNANSIFVGWGGDCNDNGEVVMSGNKSCTATFNLKPYPTVTLTANPTNIPFNTSSTLIWTSENTTSCTASGDWFGIKPVSGSEIQSNLTSNKNYLITCIGPEGVVTSTATVSVGSKPIPPSSNLSISKTSDKSTVDTGDTVTYTITLTNNGPDNATNVSVTDVLNTALNFVSATSSLGNYATTTGLWTIGNLNTASSTTLTLIATIKDGYQGQTIPNTATATSTQNDPTLENNTSTVDVKIKDPLPINNPPVITLIGSNPININVGQTYLDPGASALDQEDGDITDNIIISNTVNTATAGTYTVTYNVSDSQGLAAVPVSRTVNVLEIIPPVKGSITFCLILADTDNIIATSSDNLPYGQFSIKLSTSTDIINSIIHTKDWITTTFSPNRNIILSSNPDADCVTYNNLDLGGYYYSQLSVDGSLWLVPQYNDQNTQAVNNIFDFFPYSSELFNATTTDDSDRNTNSDGHIVITAGNKDRIVVLLEKNNNELYCPLPQITSPLSATGIIGQEFTYTITASSTTPVDFSLSGILPEGLVFSTTTNTISGILTQAGIFNVELIATNQCADGVDVKVLVITIDNPEIPSSNLSISKTSDKSTVDTGDTVTYTITLTNNGPDNATNVSVTDVLNTALNFVSATSSLGNYATTTGLWTIGNLNTASSTTLTLIATIKDGYQGQTIPNTATATSTQNDPTLENNTSTVDVMVNNPVPPPPPPPPPSPPCTANCGGGGGGGPIYPNNLTIFNEQVVETVPGVAMATWNTNLPATRRVVYGNTSNPVPGTVPNYGYQYSTDLVSGPLLTAHGMVIAIQPNQTYYFREISTDLINGVTRTVIGKELVLNPGTAPTSCYYLYDYLRKDFNNNPVEVKKLQVFLRDLEGYSTVQITGIYDDQTITALNAFQDRYKSDILTPWGHTEPTGYTYILTKKKVNEIYCRMAFPVTAQQQSEIDAYRNFLLGLQGAGIILPTTPITPIIETVPTVVPPALSNEIIGMTATTSVNSTLAGVSTTTLNIMSKFTANILTAWDMVGDWFGLGCSGTLTDCSCRFINWILLVIVIMLSYLWYREWRHNRKIEDINKEIDLN